MARSSNNSEAQNNVLFFGVFLARLHKRGWRLWSDLKASTLQSVGIIRHPRCSQLGLLCTWKALKSLDFIYVATGTEALGQLGRPFRMLSHRQNFNNQAWSAQMWKH